MFVTHFITAQVARNLADWFESRGMRLTPEGWSYVPDPGEEWYQRYGEWLRAHADELDALKAKSAASSKDLDISL